MNAAASTLLRADRVSLRAFREADVPGIVAACNDEDTRRFIPNLPAPYRAEDARAYVAQTRVWNAACDRLALAIADVATDELLGAIDVRLGEEGSIGYWVVPGARGRGIATEALRLLSTWAVREGGVRRLSLTTHPANAASQRVALNAGFRHVGAVERGLEFRDGTTRVRLFELAAPVDAGEPPGPVRSS